MNRITNIFDKLGISKEEFNQLLPRLPKSYVDFIGRRWDLKTGEELLNAVKYTPSERVKLSQTILPNIKNAILNPNLKIKTRVSYNDNLYTILGVSEETWHQIRIRMPKWYLDTLANSWNLETGEKLANGELTDKQRFSIKNTIIPGMRKMKEKVETKQHHGSFVSTNLYDILGISMKQKNQILARLPKGYIEKISVRWNVETGQRLEDSVISKEEKDELYDVIFPNIRRLVKFPESKIALKVSSVEDKVARYSDNYSACATRNTVNTVIQSPTLEKQGENCISTTEKSDNIETSVDADKLEINDLTVNAANNVTEKKLDDNDNSVATNDVNITKHEENLSPVHLDILQLPILREVVKDFSPEEVMVVGYLVGSYFTPEVAAGILKLDQEEIRKTTTKVLISCSNYLQSLAKSIDTPKTYEKKNSKS